MSQQPMVTDEELIEAAKECSHRAWTAAQTAGYHDISRKRARERLNKLVENGPLMRKKPTSQTILYWHKADYDASESEVLESK